MPAGLGSDIGLLPLDLDTARTTLPVAWVSFPNCRSGLLGLLNCLCQLTVGSQVAPALMSDTQHSPGAGHRTRANLPCPSATPSYGETVYETWSKALMLERTDVVMATKLTVCLINVLSGRGHTHGDRRPHGITGVSAAWARKPGMAAEACLKAGALSL